MTSKFDIQTKVYLERYRSPKVQSRLGDDDQPSYVSGAGIGALGGGYAGAGLGYLHGKAMKQGNIDLGYGDLPGVSTLPMQGVKEYLPYGLAAGAGLGLGAVALRRYLKNKKRKAQARR
jgi:hypothetical protein